MPRRTLSIWPASGVLVVAAAGMLFLLHSSAVTPLRANVRADADAAREVATLGTEFQRAVKNNSAATIDRILADNFVLVTGRGRVYHKAEQLREARAREDT
jgi:Domain of unknown function (DUF4440)